MRTLRFFTLSTALLLCACGPSLNEEGKNELKRIRTEYSCYEVGLGEGSETNLSHNNASINFISVNIISCSGDLNFNTVQNHLELTTKIAQNIYFNCNEKSKYNAIRVIYNLNTKRITRKEYLFILDKNDNTLKFKDSINIKPLF